MMQWARSYDEPNLEQQQWHRINWKHPSQRQELHYYVKLPRNYDPSRPHPVLITLHGQH